MIPTTEVKTALFAKYMPLVAGVAVGALVGATHPGGWMVGVVVAGWVWVLCSLCQYTGFKVGGAVIHKAHAELMHKAFQSNLVDRDCAASITKAENNLVDRLAELGPEFAAMHPRELEARDFTFHVRAAQMIVLARTGSRSGAMMDAIEAKQQ